MYAPPNLEVYLQTLTILHLRNPMRHLPIDPALFIENREKLAKK